MFPFHFSGGGCRPGAEARARRRRRAAPGQEPPRGESHREWGGEFGSGVGRSATEKETHLRPTCPTLVAKRTSRWKPSSSPLKSQPGPTSTLKTTIRDWHSQTTCARKPLCASVLRSNGVRAVHQCVWVCVCVCVWACARTRARSQCVDVRVRGYLRARTRACVRAIVHAYVTALARVYSPFSHSGCQCVC